MTRKKVKLAFITNDSARKATFKKRKKGLMKKVGELSTLCGIDACAIIYSPYESQPEVWPNTMGVQRVISQFKRMPEMEQSKKMVNQESFIRQRIAKANEQLKKQHKDNREKEMTEVMYQCLTGKGMQNMSMPDLNDLGWLIDQNLKEIYKRIDSHKKMAPHHQQISQPQAATAPPPPAHPPVTLAANDMLAGGVQVQEQKPSVDLTMDAAVHRPQWFTDWMNNPAGENMGFGHGDEMMMQFHDNHNPMWSSAFFP
ncbi:agamous-like MADS-box protein AGL80 [Coffea eugenioides]|uniref:agamous-like MADS-box protein AGL80 n=1 Tax=Coffea eugenioides TaxID=49369 RepID=UPI000F6107BD|nr:agamous-like MADS-box protein AGL80 [Coffea eugenioides]